MLLYFQEPNVQKLEQRIGMGHIEEVIKQVSRYCGSRVLLLSSADLREFYAHYADVNL